MIRTLTLIIIISMIAACGTDEESTSLSLGDDEVETDEEAWEEWVVVELDEAEDECAAYGFTLIQASMTICMACHTEPKGGLTAAFDAYNAETNINLLKEAGWTDGAKLHDYVTGKEPHDWIFHSGATIVAADVPKDDYTPWCLIKPAPMCGNNQQPLSACPSGEEWECLTVQNLKYRWECKPSLE